MFHENNLSITKNNKLKKKNQTNNQLIVKYNGNSFKD